jgi:RNA polymerase sigma-70 factor (ECF subfamily)
MEDTVGGTRAAGAVADEAILLARMQAGDDDAFEACARAYSGQLLAVAWRILSHEEDARDAVQDAFLSAFKGIGRFDGFLVSAPGCIALSSAQP